ncbi:hypothetical protein WAX78_17585 [Bacillus sp. FJAT-53711]|uniref:Uncharacterized protein n=1 Tax=Bacillus yunxiaonensis TaxID=3127665 RepID=A0ABU8FZ23_9BACI
MSGSAFLLISMTEKLSRLATSCGMTKSKMSDQLLRIVLNSPNVLEWLQQKFNKVEEYMEIDIAVILKLISETHLESINSYKNAILPVYFYKKNSAFSLYEYKFILA